MPTLRRSRTLSVAIARPPQRVYDFAADPNNLPRWVTSFVTSVRRDGDDWVVETAQGPLRWRFVPRNEFGVLDHDVRMPDGTTIRNPMRVVPNGEGSEVHFVLFQQPGMSDEEFARDAEMVERDLRTLKRVLESS